LKALFATQTFNNLGLERAITLLALLTVLLAPAPVLFYHYREAVRAKSSFVVTGTPRPNQQKKIDEKEQEDGHEHGYNHVCPNDERRAGLIPTDKFGIYIVATCDELTGKRSFNSTLAVITGLEL
jgi:hypothetical protein